MSVIYINPYAFSSLPAIGDAYEGGFFAGTISHTADGVATHALIVAPRADGASGTGYAHTTNYAWKTTNSTTAGTTSSFDGASNTAAIVTAGIANHPAANFCVGLSIGGYSDWYLPARYELEIAYYNLKPTTASNNLEFGINDYSVPKRTVNNTAGNPPKTSVSAFQDTGAEPFLSTVGNNAHWSSTESDNTAVAWALYFRDGVQGNMNGGGKVTNGPVRAFRKIAL